MKIPLISVVIPLFNAGQFLLPCLRSIVMQRFAAYEIIVVDDASSDGSLAVVRQWETQYHNLQVICNDRNYGQAYTRWRGVQAATGCYIFFMDADDWLEPNAFAALYQAAQENDARIVCCRYQRHWRGCSEVMPKADKQELESGREFVKLLLRGDGGRKSTGEALPNVSVMLWNKLFRRDLFESVEQIVPEGRQLGEDALLTFQLLLKAERVVYIPEVLYHYRNNHSRAMTRTSNAVVLETLFDNTAALRELMMREFPEPDEQIQLLCEYYATVNILCFLENAVLWFNHAHNCVLEQVAWRKVRELNLANEVQVYRDVSWLNSLRFLTGHPNRESQWNFFWKCQILLVNRTVHRYFRNFVR